MVELSPDPLKELKDHILICGWSANAPLTQVLTLALQQKRG